MIRCAFFRNRRIGSDAPEEGMQVLVRGQISVYENRGDLQFIVTHLEPAGEGALRRAFELLKKKLTEEGLFDSRYKKSLPEFPRTIGVVTSASGAALHDIRITLKRRYPLARLIVYPCLVQGDGAAHSICEMLDLAASRAEADVLILARGGGSMEDLQAFNEDSVARAIHACTLPIVTGVGHETDLTIADLVADFRAATPTAAAELVSPLIDELARDLGHLQLRMTRHSQRYLDQLRQQTDFFTARLVHPSQQLERYRLQGSALKVGLVNTARQLLVELHHQIDRSKDSLRHYNPAAQLLRSRQLVRENRRRLRQQCSYNLSSQQLQLKHLTSAVQLMSPLRTLDRGYSLLRDDKGSIVSSVSSIEPGQALTATVSDGEFGVKVSPKSRIVD